MAFPANPIYIFGVAITKSDTVNILCPPNRTLCDAIYVGGTGDIAVVPQDGIPYVLTGALTGTIIPVAAKRVNSTSTSATNLIALFSV